MTTFAPTLGGEPHGFRRVVDRPLADFRVRAGQREKLGMSPRRADRHGAEVVNAVDLDRSFPDHFVETGNEVHAEVVAQFHMVEAQAEDFLDHFFAARVAACVPSRCESEDHVRVCGKSRLRCLQRTGRDSPWKKSRPKIRNLQRSYSTLRRRIY